MNYITRKFPRWKSYLFGNSKANLSPRVYNPTLISPEQIQSFPAGEFVQGVLKLSMGAVSGSTAPYRYVEGHEEYVLTQIGQELLIGGLMYYFKIPPSSYKLLFEAMDAYQEFR